MLAALVNAQKVVMGVLRLFGSTIGATNFPVWCPDNNMADTNLFPNTLNKIANQSVVLKLFSTHPVDPPTLGVIAIEGAYPFLCEDP